MKDQAPKKIKGKLLYLSFKDLLTCYKEESCTKHIIGQFSAESRLARQGNWII